MKQTSIQIKPADPCIADLIATHTRVKPTKKDKGKGKIFALPNHPRYFLYLQPVFPAGGSSFWNVKIVEEVSPHELRAHQIFTEDHENPSVSVDGIFADP